MIEWENIMIEIEKVIVVGQGDQDNRQINQPLESILNDPLVRAVERYNTDPLFAARVKCQLGHIMDILTRNTGKEWLIKVISELDDDTLREAGVVRVTEQFKMNILEIKKYAEENGLTMAFEI